MRTLLLTVLYFFSCLAAQEKNTENILFIGNSFTFYWNLPLVVESMANERNYKFDITQSTATASSLKDHWFENNQIKSKTLISNSAFNRVVLQDHSKNPLQNYEESKEYFMKFIDHIKLNNGIPYIYTTWMYEGITNNQYDVLDPMNHTLKPLAEKTGAILVPIDKVFRIFQQRYPTIPIFTMDSKHPSPAGIYLAACVFFRIFTGDSPLGLSKRYAREDESGKKIFLGMVEESSAIKCQKIVDEILPQKL